MWRKFNEKNSKCPCKDCAERHFKCHGTCERFAEYQEGINEMRSKADSERHIKQYYIERKKRTPKKYVVKNRYE